jgi:HEAT repeat protein
MWHILQSRPGPKLAVRSVLTALLVLSAFMLSPTLVHADPVDDLRNALLLDKKELKNPSQDVVEFRKSNLRQKVDQLKTTGNLWGALALKEWKDLERSPDAGIRGIDLEMRKQIGNRLTKAIQDVIKDGDANSRLAAANSIAERGPTIRALSTLKDDMIAPGDRAGFLRTLTPLLIELTEDKDLGVRQEALRALSNVFPKPQDAAPVFKKTLEKDGERNNLEPKRLAAQGLGQLMRVANHLRPEKRGLSESTGVYSSTDDVLDAVAAALDANSSGLHDADALVRAYCLQNIELAAEPLADLIRGPQKELDAERDFPPEGRKLSGLERNLMLALHKDIAAEINDYVPVLVRLRSQGSALAAGLKDPDSRVRLAAADALESIGNARTRLKMRVLSVPPVDGGDGGNRELLAKNDTAASFIRDNLRAITSLLEEADVKLRRKAVEFLDACEEAATPALPALIMSLRDPDKFVRWTAARAIAKIDNPAAAVRALAKLLSEPDLSIRLQAAKTLKELGPVAQTAASALARAVASGDVEGRLAAMDVLQVIGPDMGKIAVPQLIECLKYPEARVRRHAATTLGGFGRDAMAAIPALRERLGDEDQDVRVHASDAMLQILQR